MDYDTDRSDREWAESQHDERWDGAVAEEVEDPPTLTDEVTRVSGPRVVRVSVEPALCEMETLLCGGHGLASKDGEVQLVWDSDERLFALQDSFGTLVGDTVEVLFEDAYTAAWALVKYNGDDEYRVVSGRGKR